MYFLSITRILNIAVFALTLFFCTPVIGQNVDQKAKFDGNLNRFISTRIKYPINLAQQNVEGLTVISFNVTETGTLDSVKVESTPHIALSRQALSALKKTKGKWTPARLNNKPVTRQYKVIVDYSVQQKLPAVNEAVEMFNHARKQFEKGKPEKSLKTLDRAIAINPYYFKFHKLRSEINMALGNEVQAKEDLDQSLKTKNEVLIVSWIAVVGVARKTTISKGIKRSTDIYNSILP